MTPMPLRQQSGMAVIAALLVVVAAAVVTTAIVEKQTLLARTLASERERAQATWMLRGGLDWSRAILRFDARTNATTRQDGIWAQPIVNLPVGTPDNPEQALFTGVVEDEQGKYNVRNLADQGLVRLDRLQELNRLFELLGLPAELAQAIAQRVADAQYGEEIKPSAPALQQVDDLMAIPDITADTVARLRPFLTILPSVTPVNVNTVSAEVLTALVPELDLSRAREVVLQRDKGVWFNNNADFINRLQLTDDTIGQRISVASQWFLVSGEIAGDTTLVAMRALLQRVGQQVPVVRWISY